MQVIDAQVHGNMVGPRAGDVDAVVTVNATVAAMDAVGVDAVVLDDFDGWDGEGRMLPGHEEPNGAWRPDLAYSEAAVRLHPDRFAYVTRVDPADPELPRIIAETRHAPGRLGLRLLKGPGGYIWQDPAWQDGGYDWLFEHAEANRVPVFLYASGRLDTVATYAARFPDLQFIVDHIGVPFKPIEEAGPRRDARLDPVVRLAEHPNIALKWCHVQWLVEQPAPFPDAIPYLRRVIDAFGVERVMWASDCTQARRRDLSANAATWAQLVDHVAGSAELSEHEKEWLLGRTVRTILAWNPTSA